MLIELTMNNCEILKAILTKLLSEAF